MGTSCSSCNKNLGIFSTTIEKEGKHYCSECYNKMKADNEKTKDERLSKAIVTTTNTLEGFTVIKYLGTVSAFSISALDMFEDWFADFRDWWGGKSSGYAKKFANLQYDVEAKLKFLAIERGGNAVIGANFNIGFVETNTGEKKLLSNSNVITRKIIVSGSGTSVIVEPKSSI